MREKSRKKKEKIISNTNYKQQKINIENFKSKTGDQKWFLIFIPLKRFLPHKFSGCFFTRNGIFGKTYKN